MNRKDSAIVQAYRSTNTNITYKDMMALKQSCKDKKLTYKWKEIKEDE